jgi:hypothetical protein
MARDYKDEYSKFGGTEAAKKKRAKVNGFRQRALKKGIVKKGDNMDMSEYKDKNGKVRARKEHRSKNRGSKSNMPGDKRARGGKKKGSSMMMAATKKAY